MISDRAELRRFALRPVLRSLASLHGSPRRIVASLVAVSGLSGVLEAVALILFTSGALRATGGLEGPVDIGPITLDAGPGPTLLIAATATILAAALHALQAHLATDTSLLVLVNARHRVAAAFLGSDWSTQAELRDGTLHSSMFLLSQNASICAATTAGVFADIIIMVALLVVATIVAPTFTLVLVVAVIPLVVILGPFTRRALRRARENVVRTEDFSEHVAVTQQLAFDLQSYGVSEAQLERINHQADLAAAAQRSARFSGRLASYWFKDFALLTFIVTVGVINLVWDLSQTTAAAAILLVIRTLGYAQQSYNAYHQVVETAPAVIELRDRLDFLGERRAQREGAPIEQMGDIEFDRVSYRYPNGRQALDDVSFTVPAGRVLGIVGRSGAGKSTVAELLLRMRIPTSGTITVDGTDVAERSVDDWRRLVTIVPQEPRVMRTNIADNIVFLREGYSRDDIVRAARASHFDADIGQFELGYDTDLGSNNRGLSGGQRQRLAIARALISQPGLLVLDEPTSALDRHSEQRLQATLNELRSGLTMVIIAHRLSTLELCDDLLVLDGGRVVAHGPRDEIMANENFFTSLPEHAPHDG